MKSPRHTARGIVIQGNKLLLVERWRGSLHYFSIPGGGIERGETPEQTVAREIAEETACVVSVKRPLYSLTTETGSQHLIFLCRYESGEPKLRPDSPEYLHNSPNNRFEPRWLDLSELNDAPFIIWKPIADQLIRDLQSGFAPDVVTLPPG
jgi:8-oxo-dGTP pyrophosphatase MutT (NUDIX family)